MWYSDNLSFDIDAKCGCELTLVGGHPEPQCTCGPEDYCYCYDYIDRSRMIIKQVFMNGKRCDEHSD
jgi:hypothetical protein